MEGKCNDRSTTNPHITQAAEMFDEENCVDVVEPCMQEGITRKEITEEIKKQLRLAGPLMVSNALQFGLQVTTIVFVGHLSNLALAGASMAISSVSVTGLTLLMGMSTGLETLCGQSFGAKEYHMVGMHMQKAILIQLFVCVLLSGIWANTGVILRAVGQDPSISNEAGIFVRFLIPGMFGYGVLQCIVRFLQTQSIILPMILISAIAFLLNILLCWVLVFKSSLGFRGAALASSISYWIYAFLLAFYVKVSSSCTETWTGFSKDALHDKMSYIRIAIPSALMVCLEAWSFEIVVLLSGLLPNPKLESSVLATTFNVIGILYMITLGLSGAGSTRVSNELGAGHPRAARLAARIVIAIASVEGFVAGIILIFTRNILGHAYSNDIEFITYIATMMLILVATNFLNGLLCVLTGIVRGCGLQKIGTYVNLGSYYIVGLPVAVLLAFVVHVGGKGLWLGITCAIFMQVIVFMVLVIRINWKEEAKKAKERVCKPAISVELPTTSHG